jgi:4-hydroxyphenylpyruvate dioxygenase
MSNSCDNPMGSKGSKGLMGFELVKFASPTPGALEPGFERMGFSLTATHHTQDVAPYRQGHTNFVFSLEPNSEVGFFTAEHGQCTYGKASCICDSYDGSDTNVDPQRTRRPLSAMRLRRASAATLNRSL